MHKGSQVYQQNLAGTIHKDQRLITTITHEFDSATAGDPKKAKVVNGRAESLQPLNGSLPGIILVSPMESKRLNEM
ncbi:MAG: hypothetical protein VST67_07835 [Nitrospirota bacterium]|nr:hypothetical protein [Nitrospirota bacterium]